MSFGRLIVAPSALSLVAFSVAAQAPAKKPSPWEPLRFYVGSWAGVGTGQPRTSVERDYSFTFNDRFLQVRNKSTGPDEFVERFEMAEPNAEFAVYSESRFKRKK